MTKVIQWATVTVGRHAVAAMHRRPDLDLVGAYVYDRAKVGRDLGELCGLAPIGVTATGDRDEIAALDADCVLYTPSGRCAPHRPASAHSSTCRRSPGGMCCESH